MKEKIKKVEGFEDLVEELLKKVASSQKMKE